MKLEPSKKCWMILWNLLELLSTTSNPKLFFFNTPSLSNSISPAFLASPRVPFHPNIWVPLYSPLEFTIVPGKTFFPGSIKNYQVGLLGLLTLLVDWFY
jgi:hypothetical protein